MRITRQIGLYKFQVHLFKEENLLSEIQDLEYLGNIERKLEIASTNLFKNNLIVENPLEELDRELQALLTSESLAKEIYQSTIQVSSWIQNETFTRRDIEYYRSFLSAQLSEFDNKAKKLDDFVEYLRSVEIWDENLKVCPFLKTYQSLISDDSGIADIDGDGILSFEEIQEFLLKGHFLCFELHTFVSNREGFLDEILKKLKVSITHVEEIWNKYLNSQSMLSAIDSQLEHGFINEAFKLRETTTAFPEIYDNISTKLSPLVNLEFEIDKFTQKLRSFAQPRILPELFEWRFGLTAESANPFHIFPKTKILENNLSESVGHIQKFHELHKRLSGLPVGCSNYLSLKLGEMNEEFGKLEKFCGKLSDRKRFYDRFDWLRHGVYFCFISAIPILIIGFMVIKEIFFK